MNLVTVRCNECGAPLETSDSARYLTCNHCGSQLSVQRTASSIFTEKLEAIEERTEAIAGSIDVIRVQNDIAQLDREWVMEREKHLVHGKRGTHEPGPGNVIGSAVGLVVGLMILWVEMSARSRGMMTVMGLFFTVMCGAGLVGGIRKADKLHMARTLYESRRRELQAELARLR